MPHETAYLLNPGRRARRTRRRARPKSRRRRNHMALANRPRRKRRRRRRNMVVPMANPRRRRRRSATRKRRRRNMVVPMANPRRRRGRSATRKRRRRNAGALAGVRIGFPEVVPGLRLPIPGFIGKIANGAVQGVFAGGVVFGGYFASGALVNYVCSPQDAKAARDKGEAFMGYWVRPLLFAGSAGVFGAIAAGLAPRSKGMLWSILAAAGPALRAFGGVAYAILGDEATKEPGFKGDMARLSVGLSDYLQVGDLYEAGMGDEEDDDGGGEGMEDYLQVGGDAGVDDLFEAGMGDEDEDEGEGEVIGI